MTSSTDPFSASIIPFEVPEQMRAFAEKGVSQARDSYAKFKDAAETHNGTIEAVFTSASKGASEYSAKLIEFFKANTTSSLDFAQELFGVKTPAEAMELWTSHARKQFETFTAQAKELAELGQKVATETVEPIKATAVEALQAGRLIDPAFAYEKPGRSARAFCCLSAEFWSAGPGRKSRQMNARCPRDDYNQALRGLAKAGRCT